MGASVCLLLSIDHCMQGLARKGITLASEIALVVEHGVRVGPHGVSWVRALVRALSLLSLNHQRDYMEVMSTEMQPALRGRAVAPNTSSLHTNEMSHKHEKPRQGLEFGCTLMHHAFNRASGGLTWMATVTASTVHQVV
jgi:hypothetical protein